MHNDLSFLVPSQLPEHDQVAFQSDQAGPCTTFVFMLQPLLSHIAILVRVGEPLAPVKTRGGYFV